MGAFKVREHTVAALGVIFPGAFVSVCAVIPLSSPEGVGEDGGGGEADVLPSLEVKHPGRV